MYQLNPALNIYQQNYFFDPDQKAIIKKPFQDKNGYHRKARIIQPDNYQQVRLTHPNGTVTKFNLTQIFIRK